MRSLGYKDDEYEVKRLLPPLLSTPTPTPTSTIIKNFVIGLHVGFENNKGGGGYVVQCHLANLLRNRGFNVRLLTAWINPPQLEPPNFIFTHADTDKPNDIDVTSDDTIVVYCEGVIGNPFKAKNVVRWMLSELGKNSPYDRLTTWDKNEVIYYFNGEPKHSREPEKMGNIYKLLPLLYFNPKIQQYNNQQRDKECYTLRKYYYHEHLHIIHPDNTDCIDVHNDHDVIISIFNEYKCFYCYDP